MYLNDLEELIYVTRLIIDDETFSRNPFYVNAD